MIVRRMERLDVNQAGPAGIVLRRDSQHPLAHRVAPGGGPAIGIGDHGDALGPQREELDRPVRAVSKYLYVCIAVQQQMRGQCLQQRLARAGRVDQPGKPRIGGQQRRAAYPFGGQAHGALRHRIFQKCADHRLTIFERHARPGWFEGEMPGGGEAARQRRTAAAPALEGGSQRGEEGHGGFLMMVRKNLSSARACKDEAIQRAVEPLWIAASRLRRSSQ